jgi:putative ATPase
VPARKPPRADDFDDVLQERLASAAPLAARMRPRTLDEIVGQRHLLGPGAPLRALIESDRLSSIILWGPPGTGKTTIARVIAARTNREFIALSAVTAGVKDVREVTAAAQERLVADDRGTILFLDEVHRFNKSQQDALLPAVESGVLTLIGATTENPFFEVNAPLISRSTLFRLELLSTDELGELVDRGAALESVTLAAAARAHLVDLADGDGRAALTTLEVAIAIAAAESRTEVSLDDVEAARQTRVLRYGDDDHYDIISAFIKAIRGSDPDAGMYWLARMLAAGEDARYIARRLVILASEDVGLADSNGLVVADAAARAVEFVGLPEAALNLAHATLYLATAPKSNTVAAALIRVNRAIRDKPEGAVPIDLKQQHPYQRNKLKEGGGYQYPHNEPSGFIAQSYRPPEVEDSVYYRPSPHGDEAAIGERVRAWWADRYADGEQWYEFEKFRSTDPER